MKKITLYLSILMSLLITACSNEDIPAPLQQEEEINETCEVSFSVTIPEAVSATRALGEATVSSIGAMKVLVFNENGEYLTNHIATPSNQSSTGGKYIVSLNTSGYKRIVHFIATKDELEIPYARTESELMAKLNVNEQKEAYWQRVVLENGIDLNTFKGTNNNPIPLIRNFARVTLRSIADNFILEGFILVNTAKSASVAPYMYQANNDGDIFPDYNANSTYAGLLNDGYMGVQPNRTLDDLNTNYTFPTTYTANNITIGEGITADAKYMYERIQDIKYNETEKPVFLIVKGKRTDATRSGFYRVDILKKATDNTHMDEPYKIFRNFSYNITIKSVSGDGYITAQEAYENVASNNLSTSSELQNLLNIAYGDERLYVSTTEIVWTKTTPFTLLYKYEVKTTSAGVTTTEIRNTKDEDVTFIGFRPSTNEEETDFPVISSYEFNNNEEPSTDAGYATITITPKGLPTGGQATQEVSIKAGSLSRTINLILRQPYQFISAQCTSPGVNATAGAEFVYAFTLPSGIAKSLFPMVFLIEANPQTIYPNTNSEHSMPVKILDGSFGYERTVTWEEYQASGGVITCDFKINTADKNSTTDVEYASTITVSNTEYFSNTVSADLNGVSSIYIFKDFAINGGNAISYGENVEVPVTLTCPVTSNTIVYITAPNMKSASIGATSLEMDENGRFIYRPTSASKQTITFVTNKFVSAGSIKLEASNYITAVKSYDNVLKIKAASVTGTTTPTLDDNSKIRVYASESDAKAYGDNYLAEVTRSTLTSTETTIALTGLTEESKLYFAYEGTTHIYVGEATAEALAGATAEIAFNESYEKPLEITNAMLNPTTVSIGSGQKVTLTFHMNKKETITINAEWLTSSSVVNGKYTPKQTGNQTIEFTTTDALRGGNVVINNNDDLTLSYIRNLTINQFEVNQELSVNGDINKMTIYVVTDSGNVSIGTCNYNQRIGNDRLEDISINIPNDYDGIIDNSTNIVITGQRNNRTYTIDDITLGDLINRDI